MGATCAFVVGVEILMHFDPTTNNHRVGGAVVPTPVYLPSRLAASHSAQDRPPSGLIRGTRILTYGSRLLLSGRASTTPGNVKVLGKWNSGRWITFAVANADGHRYSFSFPINHHGTLQLRVIQPDGYVSVAIYHVS
jgi:hypothetical protein